MSYELYSKLKALSVDASWIGLSIEEGPDYFCTPIGSTIIGWDNGIHYCFIEGFGEMVFCVNPETCCDYYVYPLANNFNDFLSLILATQNTNTMQQVILWDKKMFELFMNDPSNIEYSTKKEVQAALNTIRSELNIQPMKDPFEYIKKIQQDFPYNQIKYSDEFYDITGLCRPI